MCEFTIDFYCFAHSSDDEMIFGYLPLFVFLWCSSPCQNLKQFLIVKLLNFYKIKIGLYVQYLPLKLLQTASFRMWANGDVKHQKMTASLSAKNVLFISKFLFLVMLLTDVTAAIDEDGVSQRSKRQSNSNINRAWEEALPGVQPFWEKYSTGPYGIVIRGWQFSRCASEQVKWKVDLSRPKARFRCRGRAPRNMEKLRSNGEHFSSFLRFHISLH